MKISQSIKKLKGFLKEWCLDNDGWNLTGSSKKYSLTSIDEDKYKESTFYKERWINENGLEQKCPMNHKRWKRLFPLNWCFRNAIKKLCFTKLGVTDGY